MSEAKIIDLIERSDCRTTPSTGLPKDLSLPSDLAAFYRRYGSAVIHSTQPYPYAIQSAQHLERSDFAVLGEDLDDPDSAGWHVLVRCADQIISVELKAGPRFGYCYDSFWDSYPTADESTLVAKSFTELLERMIACGGKRLFWIPGHD